MIDLAHETWFTGRRPPYDWSFTTSPGTIALVIAVVIVAVVWRLVARRIRSPELPFLSPLGRLAPWLPRLLGVHAGVSLLAQASSGTYLAPALTLPSGAWGTFLAILEAVTGIWLIAGYHVRPAALLLVLAGPAGMIGYGLVPILERVDLLGIALFLAILPPDDRAPGGKVRIDRVDTARAIFGMRVLVGAALITLAFTEKLARPALALAFLDRFPFFNVLKTIGLDVSDLTFVRIAGAIELLFGLLILSGSLPQLAVLIAGIPFNATLFFLGSSELIGHLPIYGAMLVLLVYGSNHQTASLVPHFPWEKGGSSSRTTRLTPIRT